MRAITREERVAALEKNVNDTIKKDETDRRIRFAILVIATIALISLIHTMIGG